MSARLPWERNPTGGFVAWPEGREQQPKRLAVVRPLASNGTWNWSVSYDGSSSNGYAATAQDAADAATEAWPKVMAAAAVGAVEQAAEAARRAAVDQAAEASEPDVSIFASEAASYENMMLVMQQLRGRTEPGALQIIAALSREFLRRRKG